MEFLFQIFVLVDESSLTGESEPVMVTAENPFLLSGTGSGWIMQDDGYYCWDEDPIG